MLLRYRSYSGFLKDKYGGKVYKLPVNLPVTCPNRDGQCGTRGCIFCSEVGAGFETLSAAMPVKEQLEKNKAYIGQKYHADRFIAYFQNFTNTYLPVEEFERTLEEACIEGVVGIAVSTRPDCVHPDYLEVVRRLVDRFDVEVTWELGLQTVNYHTLKRIGRGHSLAEFIDAVSHIQSYGFSICTHMILNLPWDTMEDVIEDAKILSALRIDQVKLHALYILEGTAMGELYQAGAIEMIRKEEYIERVVTFLEYLDPDMVIQRLIGRAPKENSLFVNWGTSWWKIKDEIDAVMEARDTWQGKRYDYLLGKAVRKRGWVHDACPVNQKKPPSSFW